MGGGRDPFSKLLGLEPPKTPVTPTMTEEQKKKAMETEEFKKSGKLFQIGFAGAPTLPPIPDIGEQDRIRLRAIAERLRKAMLTGRGRAATIATSPLGVTNGAKLQRRQLTGA